MNSLKHLVGKMEDINALELLKEEMSTEEIHLKVNAIHRLKIVVLCLGQNDSVSQLLPYLDGKLNLSVTINQRSQTKKTTKCFLQLLRNLERSGSCIPTRPCTCLY